MKRFVLGTNRTTVEQDAAFISYIQTHWPNLGWWHQLSETWFFVDVTDTVTAAMLRDAAMVAFPGIYVMVVEEGGTWAGLAPKEMYQWMEESWAVNR